MKALIALAITFAAAPNVASAEELTVGSCPSKIVVDRFGEWEAISNDLATVELLRKNPNLIHEVAASYVVDDTSMLEVVVLSLQGLEKYQGTLSESDFNVLREEFAELFQGPTPEVKKEIDKGIEKNLAGTGSSASHLRYESPTSSPGEFIGFALTEMSVPGSEATLYESAMKLQHIRGCIVQANFSIAVAPGSRKRLAQAVSDFVMR